jgi:hypothetical protein
MDLDFVKKILYLHKFFYLPYKHTNYVQKSPSREAENCSASQDSQCSQEPATEPDKSGPNSPILSP